MHADSKPQRRQRSSRRKALSIARLGFGAVGVAFLASAVQSAVHRSPGNILPGWQPAVLAGLLLLLALFTASRGWTSLFGAHAPRRALGRAYFLSQLGKYIPGGVWQFVAQLTLSAGPGIPAARVAMYLPLHVITQLCGGLVLAAVWGMAAFDKPALWRIAAVGGLASAFVLRREVISHAVRLAARIARTPSPAEGSIPAQSVILESTAWNAVTLLLSGGAFAVILGALQPGENLLTLALAFPLAWVIGFLALPFPAGVGVREAALLLLLGSPAPSVVTASVIHRIMLMTAEGVLALLGFLGRR